MWAKKHPNSSYGAVNRVFPGRVTVDFPNKMGLAQRGVMRCDDNAGCSWEYSMYLSETVKVGEHNRFDINIRSIVAFREIGRCKTHIDTFHRVMNVPTVLAFKL